MKTNIVESGRHVSKAQVQEFARRARTEPAEAARVILNAVEKDKQHVFVGTDAKALAAAKRVAPASTLAFVAWAMPRLPGGE